MLTAHGRAGFIGADEDWFPAVAKRLKQLDRVPDAGRTRDDLWALAVGSRDSQHPTEHVREVGSKHTLVDVHLVDDHEGQIGKEPLPEVMVWENARVKHVGVGDEHLGMRPQFLSLIIRDRAVVTACSDGS